MWFLIAVGCIIPFVFLGHLLSRLDKFLDGGGFQNEENKVSPTAVVLGVTELAIQITGILKNEGITVLTLTEPFLLEQGQNFEYLFALSDNDTDNIILCKIGRKVYNIDKMISICNDFQNKNMFKTENIRYLSRQEVTAQMLYQAVLQKVEANFFKLDIRS